MEQLIRAEYLITDPELLATGVITDGALVLAGGRVAAAGPWTELKAAYGHLAPIGGPDNWLVMPGLVNAHHHGRGLSTIAAGMPDAPLELWLPAFALYPPVDVYYNTLYAAACMLRSGVTASLQSHSHGGPLSAYRHSVEAALAAYREAGVRISFAMGLFDQQYLAYIPDRELVTALPPALRQEFQERFDLATIYIDSDDYFALFEELYPQCGGAEYPLARLLLSPCGLHWASDELLGRMAAVAQAHQTGVHTHLLETCYQRAYAHHRFGMSAVEALERFNLLGPHISLAHAIWLSEADMERLAATKSTVVTNASSNLRLGSGILPLNRLRERGVNVAIGMDSTALSDDEDMLREMRLVATLHREPGLDSNWPLPYEVLRMATVGGARAALLEGQVGRLLPGYRADVTVLNLERIRTPYAHPDADPVALALACGQAADVDTVLVEGEVLLKGGQFTRLDLAEVESALAESIQAQAGPAYWATHRFLQALEPYLLAIYRRYDRREATGGAAECCTT